MGNRAVIAFSDARNAPSIYLHWNGGRASVEGFLLAARQAGIKYTTATETINAIAELVATHFFGVKVGEMHVYVETYGRADTDNGDNGTYILNQDLSIGRRLHLPSLWAGEEVDAEKIEKIVKHILWSRQAAAEPVKQS